VRLLLLLYVAVVHYVTFYGYIRVVVVVAVYLLVTVTLYFVRRCYCYLICRCYLRLVPTLRLLRVAALDYPVGYLRSFVRCGCIYSFGCGSHLRCPVVVDLVTLFWLIVTVVTFAFVPLLRCCTLRLRCLFVYAFRLLPVPTVWLFLLLFGCYLCYGCCSCCWLLRLRLVGCLHVCFIYVALPRLVTFVTLRCGCLVYTHGSHCCWILRLVHVGLRLLVVRFPTLRLLRFVYLHGCLVTLIYAHVYFTLRCLVGLHVAGYVFTRWLRLLRLIVAFVVVYVGYLRLVALRGWLRLVTPLRWLCIYGCFYVYVTRFYVYVWITFPLLFTRCCLRLVVTHLVTVTFPLLLVYLRFYIWLRLLVTLRLRFRLVVTLLLRFLRFAFCVALYGCCLFCCWLHVWFICCPRLRCFDPLVPVARYVGYTRLVVRTLFTVTFAFCALWVTLGLLPGYARWFAGCGCCYVLRLVAFAHYVHSVYTFTLLRLRLRRYV